MHLIIEIKEVEIVSLFFIYQKVVYIVNVRLAFMRTEQIMCLNHGRSKRDDCGHVKSILAPSEILFTDRSKAVLLSWFIFVIVRL